LGWQLASLYFNPNVRYELDLSSINSNQSISLKQNLPENLKLSSRLEALDIIPESFNIILDDFLEKKVPVKAIVDISCTNGYGVIGQYKTTPDSIIISGAARMVRNISFWPTKYQKYTDIKDEIANIVPLSDTLSQILKLSHKMIGLEIHVQMLAEQKYNDIEINVIGLPVQTSVNLIPPKVDIIVRSGVEILASFDKSEIKAVLDYKNVSVDSSGFVTPKIILPEGLRIIKMEPSRFEYVIRKKSR
jgi:YbbR domain-containing protein